MIRLAVRYGLTVWAVLLASAASMLLCAVLWHAFPVRAVRRRVAYPLRQAFLGWRTALAMREDPAAQEIVRRLDAADEELDRAMGWLDPFD